MACACRGSKKKFVWTSEDGKATIEYDSDVVAKAKVKRSGGSFTEKATA